MTSPGDPIYIAAQIIQACQQGVHDPDMQPRPDQLQAARTILLALQLPEPHRRLQHILNQMPTTQTLFPTPLNHQENQP